MCFTVIFGFQCSIDELTQIFFELGQSLFAGERFVKTKAGDDDVGFVIFQIMAVVLKIFGTGAEGQFVSRPAQVPDNQFFFRKTTVKQCFEIAGILHAFSKCVADDHDVIVRFYFQQW